MIYDALGLKDAVLFGDALQELRSVPDELIQMCVTSPPYYGLRDYGEDGQIGLEETPEKYVQRLVDVFREVRRVLKDDGTLWLNIGDSYATGTTASRQPGNKGIGLKGDSQKARDINRVGTPVGMKTKDLMGIPWMLAFALRNDGWYLRQDIIWHKPNPMPESVKDRCTNAYEHVFLLSKSPQYYYDWEAIAEKSVSYHSSGNGFKRPARETFKNSDGTSRGDHRPWEPTDKRNKRNVWSIYTKPFPDAHFAVFPAALVSPCVKAGSKPYDIVLDPFFGSGTTGEVCMNLNRHYLGIELNKDYEPIQDKRLSQQTLSFT